MRRRQFIHHAAYGAGAAFLGSRAFAQRMLALPALSQKFSAADTVTIGKTGIQTSRLAMGTGTVGSGHHSHQTALGVKGLSELLLNGYEHGLRFFDAADSYGSHPHVAEALKHVPRDKVTVLTKTWARDAATAKAADCAEVNGAVQHLPAAPAEAANPARRGSNRQRYQQNESGKSHGDEWALVHIFPDFGKVEELVEQKIGGEVQAGVEKRKQAKHAAKANQLRNVKELAQRRDGQGDEEEAECPIAGRMLNEFERIGLAA